MKGNGIRYFFRQSFRYFWSNKIMSFASVGVLATCLFIMCTFLLVAINLNNNIRGIEEKNEIVCFVDETLDDAGVTAVGERLAALPNVSECVFVPKEEALAEYKEQFGENSSVFDGLDENPLRHSYTVKLENLDQFDETLAQVESTEGVAYVRSSKDVVDGIISLRNVVATVSFWIMVLLLLSSLFIIVNTIKLARFVYRKQINIMKYIGATDWFIRWPFILEGGFIGLLAGGLSFGMVWYAYYALLEKLTVNNFLFSILPFSNFVYLALGILLGGGILIGVLGSAITIRKYLDA